MQRFDSKILKELMQHTLKSYYVNEDSLYHVTESLIQTSLRGVDSHGINLFPHYINAIKSGRINKNPKIQIKDNASSTAILYADHSFGHHSGAIAMDYAIKKSKSTGIFAINVRNSTHFGAAAYFALKASEKNCIGFSFTNADALVKAFGSKDSFFGTNPICFTAPLMNEEPLCLDMATSLVSWNKIKNYRRNDKEIPKNWAFDKNGAPVINPHEASSLSPAGEYKGFGLGMMVDILCAVLGESTISKDIIPMYTSIEKKRDISHFFMALDIEKFLNISVFKTILQNMVNRIRSLPKLNNIDSVMVPGDPEKIKYKKRISKGIPVDNSVLEEFFLISESFKNALIS